MTDDIQLYAVTVDGPVRLRLPHPVTSIHDLPDDLPFGIYTAFRTFDHNKFLYLDAHLARMEQSIELLGWQYTLDRPALRRALDQVCTDYAHANARVRVDVLEGQPSYWQAATRLLMTLAPFVPVSPRYYQNGVRVGLARRLHRELPQAKRADFVLARRDYPLGRPEAYDYLLLDDEEHILEGSSSNFYVVCGQTLRTAGNGVLEGITRKIILQRLAPALSLPVHFQAPVLGKVDTFDEAFLSSSSRGIVPVVNIAGTVVGDGNPGEVTHRLMDAYRRFVSTTIRPAVA